jgi:gamma-glutamyltranspeptidase/glutathione hydrolase
MLRVARGEDAAAALSAPRFGVGGLDAGDPTDTVLVEARVDDGTVERFRTAGMPVVTLDDVDENVGHAQMIRRGPGGELTAATDPRADGSARVIDPG